MNFVVSVYCEETGYYLINSEGVTPVTFLKLCLAASISFRRILWKIGIYLALLIFLLNLPYFRGIIICLIFILKGSLRASIMEWLKSWLASEGVVSRTFWWIYSYNRDNDESQPLQVIILNQSQLLSGIESNPSLPKSGNDKGDHFYQVTLKNKKRSQ